MGLPWSAYIVVSSDLLFRCWLQNQRERWNLVKRRWRTCLSYLAIKKLCVARNRQDQVCQISAQPVFGKI